MAELPILPLKTDALLADTSHMTVDEFGAYCRILFVMWRHGGRLKDDDTELAIIVGLSKARWLKIAEKVRRPLTAADGKLSQKRLTDTWIDVQELRAKRASRALEQWKGKRTADATVDTDAGALQMHMQVHSKCTGNQNQISNLSSFPASTRASSASLEGVLRKRGWTK